MIDVDKAAAQRPAAHPLAMWAPAIASVVAAVALGAVVLSRPSDSRPGGARPEFVLAVDNSSTAARDFSQGTPTAIAYYADGTTADAAQAITTAWRPDKPMVMLTLVAQRSCTIVADGQITADVAAPTMRLAVCIWRSSD